MLFNSITFAVFLPIVFGLYWWLGRTKSALRNQNIFLLIASYVFYGWWDPRFLSLIFISSLVDFVLGLQMEKRTEKKQRKPLLILSIVVNLGLLGFFKYYNFFVESLVTSLAEIGVVMDPWTLDIILPVGISFYTFQTLSYTIDIYRGNLNPSRDVVAFFAYVSFFPQLVAGPIEKARDLLPQFVRTRKFSYPQAVSGLRLVLYGMFKKVVVADRVAEYVDQIFGNAGAYTELDFLLAGIFFSVQLYCDFSGYSDIAIGLARLFGFELSINFRTPLFSKSLAELWRRWHISLNAWFRDYVYRPLGGRGVSKSRWYFNITMIFFLSGLWHGATWPYVFWGLFSAALYILELAVGHNSKNKTGWKGLLSWAWTYTGFLISLVFLRAYSAGDAFRFFKNFGNVFSGEMAIFDSYTSSLNAFMSDGAEALYVAILCLAFFGFDFLIGKGSLDDVLGKWTRWGRWCFYYILILWMLLLGPYGVPQQFFYFQF